MLELWYTVCYGDDLHELHKSIRIPLPAHPSQPGSPRGTALLAGAWQSWSRCGQAGLLNIWKCQTNLQIPFFFPQQCLWVGRMDLPHSFVHMILYGGNCMKITQILALTSRNSFEGNEGNGILVVASLFPKLYRGLQWIQDIEFLC